jgi:type III secretion protein F
MAKSYSNGLLVSTADAFEVGGDKLFKEEERVRALLAGGESANPATLASYQAIISEISILRNAQSSIIKVFKDMDATIVANFR